MAFSLHIDDDRDDYHHKIDDNRSAKGVVLDDCAKNRVFPLQERRNVDTTFAVKMVCSTTKNPIFYLGEDTPIP